MKDFSFTPKPPDRSLYMPLIDRALEEDIGHGDVTTSLVIPYQLKAEASIVAREEAVVAGTFVSRDVFLRLDDTLEFSDLAGEGTKISKDGTIMRIRGRASSILQGERVALNFLQRLCAIATLTRKFVEKVSGLSCRIIDTRKTTPCMRILQKYAMRAGGGSNHRFGLYDGILIKDNHIAACGSIKEALKRAGRMSHHNLRPEIEVSDLSELMEAMESGAEAVLLDNFTPLALKEAVKIARETRPGMILEASGGITLNNVREYAETGVDLISVGALTHSAGSVDLSLEFSEA